MSDMKKAKKVEAEVHKKAAPKPKIITLFTSESVTEGHPDKMCDQISDAVLDEILARDPKARVAVECLITNGVLTVAGEVTTSTYVEIPDIARRVIKDIGYTNAEYGFHYQTSGIQIAIQKQSSDIERAVDSYTLDSKGKVKTEDLENLGAGDQGLMFGFACLETPELMPLPIMLAHKLCKKLSEARKKNLIKGLRPDGKSQVTVEYHNGKPKRINTVLIAAQHDSGVSQEKLKEEITKKVILKVLPLKMVDKKTNIFVNSSGQFVVGGPQADTGLTGRKIIVDTYGGYSRHGGGCFSGKDPSKVDRSGSYIARYVAKNIVAAGLATKCEVQISYAIGKPEPLSVHIDSFGTSKYEDQKLADAVAVVFDLRPGAIIKQFNLRRPIYRQVAAYGHFGRPELKLPWEKIDKVKTLKQQFAKKR